MSGRVFGAMSSRLMAGAIDSARERVVVAAPAVREEVAEAIVRAMDRLGPGRVTVTIDCDEEVMRLGYGEVPPAHRLKAAGCDLRQSSGLRIGLLIVDRTAWVFTPTALYVQDEVHSAETPNAVVLGAEEADRLAVRASHAERERAALMAPSAEARQAAADVEVEIGSEPLSQSRIDSTANQLALVPALEFDLARQVRVFAPYVQYVDAKLTGCAIQRRRINIPASVAGIGGGAELQERLRTVFDLVERSSSVSSKSLEEELRRIREDYTCSLGEPWGRVILRARRTQFDEEIKQLRAKLEKHQAEVRSGLQEHLDRSLGQIVKHYLPAVVASPPRALSAKVTTEKPTEEQAERWLRQELGREFPTAETLVADMRLEVQFRDVTYETLQDERFRDALKRRFTLVDWDKPFAEFNAAAESGPKPRG